MTSAADGFYGFGGGPVLVACEDAVTGTATGGALSSLFEGAVAGAGGGGGVACCSVCTRFSMPFS